MRGDDFTHMRSSARRWEPQGGEVWDSTDWASWRNRTDVTLEALFLIPGTETYLEVRQTASK